MNRMVALLCHGMVLLAALRWAHSTSGFLVTGLGLMLLLDTFALRVVPGRLPIAWTRELAIRAGYFFGGGAAFYLMRPGLVPLWEATYRGMMVCLAAFLLERFVNRVGSTARTRAWLRGALLALFVLVIPPIAALHPLHTVPKRTPAAFGLAFEDVRFRTADGVQLAAWLVPHPHPQGNVIFCHGHGRNRGHVAGLLATLHALGLNVLAFDFRGHGDSEGHTSTFGDREVQDVRAAVAYLNEKCPGQPVFLIGISLGAAVSIQALPELPEVRGLWSEGAFARLRHAVDRELAPAPPALRRPLAGVYYLLGWADCGLWGPAVNPIDRLRQVEAPIFFCHAERDELVPLTDGQALNAAYAGPKDHWWVAGASHYNVRQRNREEYLRRLRGFLEACLARHAEVVAGAAVQGAVRLDTSGVRP